MDKSICRIQNTKNKGSKKKWRQLWKKTVQISERCRMQQNNGKLKQLKILFEMEIKINLYVTINI